MGNVVKDGVVADDIFGDDAGFLSGLGINVESKKEKEKGEVEKIDVSEDDKHQKEEDKMSVYMDDDIVPALKEAKIVKKSTKVTTNKTRSDVDDLIKRKSQVNQSAYHDIGGGRVFSSGKGNILFGRGKKRKKPSSFQKEKDNSATIRLGVTKNQHNRKNMDKSSEEKKITLKKKRVYKVSDDLKKKGIITIGDHITVKEFSEKMGVPLQEVMKVLLANKIITAVHAHIDFDTAVLVAGEFDVEVKRESTKIDIETVLSGDLHNILEQDKDASDFSVRPPIVTIMGHVDHGKTSLLDFIRKTDVLGSEAGGITQSIGASQIIHNDQKITFIDTPGHELFTSIRARGSKVTNIVVIVVSADDGVKPQTIEAIHHAQDAGVPIIVAITKIDLGVHKLEEIKGQLAQHGLQPEDWGGDTMIIPCSSKTGQGVDDLLDAILLQHEMLELGYSPSRDAVGVVIESQRDEKKGVLTTLLIMTGTLKVGDIMVIHNTFGKVKKMMDWTGKVVQSVSGGDPVLVMGLQKLPEPGRIMEVVKNTREAQKKIALLQAHEMHKDVDMRTQSLIEKINKGESAFLKLILKADSFGGLETLKHAANQIKMPENVELKIIHDNVGSITNSDIVFAQASGAVIIGFNVSATGNIKKKAKQLNVRIIECSVIYDFVDFVQKLAQGLIEVDKQEVFVGKLEILGIFYKKGKEVIFGGKVLQGEIRNHAFFKIWRTGKEVDEGSEFDSNNEEYIFVKEDGKKIKKRIKKPSLSGEIVSLQQEQQPVSIVKKGHECGIKARVSQKVEIGDIVECFVIETG